VLAAVLADHGVPQALRWQVPRCIAAFGDQRAADVLLSSLPDEWDGMQRYQVIRALETLVRRQPTLRLDRHTLNLAIVGTVARAYRYLDRRLSLERGAIAVPARRTPGHELLARMLDDKRTHSVDRLLRLLALAHPRESFADIRIGLGSGGRDRRASGLELLGNLLRPPLRDAVVALVDDLADDDRLRAGADFHQPVELDYDGLLESMLASQSQAVQDLTAYHIGELQLTRFLDQLGTLAGVTGPERIDVRRALERLRAPQARASS
jgi:hypothetical protein